MKKVIIAFVAAFSVIAVGLVILLIFAINRDVDTITISDEKTKLVNTQNVSIEGIDTIDVKFYSDDIVYYTSDTNELIVKEYKNYTPDEDELAKITTTGSNLTIQGKKHNTNIVFMGINNRYSRIEVYLPTEYKGTLSTSTSSGDISSDLVLKLAQFSTESSSGDVEMNEVNAEEINITATSGDITIQKAEGKRQITTSSGDIKVYGGNGDSSISASSGDITIEKASGLLEIGTSSGDIKITDTNGEKDIDTSSGEVTIKNSVGFVEASSSSGDIRISAQSGGGTINTTSGELQFEVAEVTDNIDFKTTSGDVTLRLPNATNFTFTADTSSGDIGTFFDDKLSFNKRQNHASGTVGENPSLDVQIRTTSGEINVDEY